MIPVTKGTALAIVAKRLGTAKICCVFCERRIGWLEPHHIEDQIKTYGVTLCDDCKTIYVRWKNDSI